MYNTDTLFRAPRRSAVVEVMRAVLRGLKFTRVAASVPSAEVPPLRRSPVAVAGVLADELFVTVGRLRSGNAAVDMALLRDEVGRAAETLRAGGYVDEPALLHAAPGLPGETRLTVRRVIGRRFEHVSFPSVYEPPPGMVRAAEWRDRQGNHTAHAYLVRRDDRPRPWVVVIHGYSRGEPIDLHLMGAWHIHRSLGANVVFPVLPLHGPRGRATNIDRFPSVDPIVNLYGLSQAVRDVRSVIAWIRSEGATDVAVYGVSLGGHTAALLASLEPDLAGVVAGVPTSDFTALLVRSVARLDGEEAVEALGLLDDSVVTLNRLVSPLTLRPLVAPERRYIFAAVGDRIANAEQAVALWRHWERPQIEWFQGSHVGSTASRSLRRFAVEALGESLAANWHNGHEIKECS